MTKKQRITLQADWWPAACRAQGWKTSDRELRLKVCAWAVSLADPSQIELLEAIQSDREPSRRLSSTNDLDNKGDIDRVKACLGMLADSLKATREVGHAEIGCARRKRNVIRCHVRCLGLFEEHPRRFLASLVNDMFNHGQPGLTIRDLTDDPNIRTDGKEGPSDLDRLMMRLAQVVNDKRRANELVPAWKRFQQGEPMRIHDMKLLVGVPCDCAGCDEKGLPRVLPMEGIEDWSDLEPELEFATDELGGGYSVGDPF